MSLSRKTVPMMKSISLLAIMLTLAATTLSAQTTNKVTLNKTRVTLAEIFEAIEKQTNSVVIVNTNKTDRGKVVTLTDTEGTVAEILDSALSGIGQTYQSNGRYIIIVAAEKEEKLPVQTKAAALPDNGYTPSYGQQPAQSEFERDVTDYTRRNLSDINTPRATAVRYDTIYDKASGDGVFAYPDRSMQLMRTRREIIRSGQAHLLDTPPVFAIKTNLLYWATGTPNLSIEFGLGKKTSLDITAGYNPWNLEGSFEDNKKLVHWIVRPEFRYWLCERFNGHFFGLHAFYWQYNISEHNVPMLFEKEFRYQGNAFGAGVSYGYHWAWSKRWGMEVNLGAGVAFLDYTKKDCVKCGHEVGKYRKNYFGPTSAGIKLLFMAK